MYVHAARLLIAAASLSGVISTTFAETSSSNGIFIHNSPSSQRLPRPRRQAFAFDEFGLPRYSPSQGSTVFQVAKRTVGIPGSFLGNSNVFDNELPLIERDALQTTEQPRYGPNHPLLPNAFPTRYSTTSPTNNVNLNNQTLSSKTEQTTSSVVLPPDSFSITDKVTDSPVSLLISSTLSSDDLPAPYGQQSTQESGPDFLSTKPSIPFPLTIDPDTPGPSVASEQPSSLTSISITAAPVLSASSTECFCPCLTAETYSPAKASYTPPPPPLEPSVYPQVTTVPFYTPPPPPLRPSFTDVLSPLQPLQSPALIFGPAPPRGSAGPVLTQFPLPFDGQVGHPEPPAFEGDSNALEQPTTQGQIPIGFLPPRQFGIGQFSQFGQPEPPSTPLRHYSSKLTSNGTFLRAAVMTSFLPALILILFHL